MKKSITLLATLFFAMCSAEAVEKSLEPLKETKDILNFGYTYPGAFRTAYFKSVAPNLWLGLGISYFDFAYAKASDGDLDAGLNFEEEVRLKGSVLSFSALYALGKDKVTHFSGFYLQGDLSYFYGEEVYVWKRFDRDPGVFSSGRKRQRESGTDSQAMSFGLFEPQFRYKVSFGSQPLCGLDFGISYPMYFSDLETSFRNPKNNKVFDYSKKEAQLLYSLHFDFYL